MVDFAVNVELGFTNNNKSDDDGNDCFHVYF